MEATAIRLCDERRYRSSAAGEDGVIGSDVRMSTEAGWVAIVIAEKLLQIIHGQSPQTTANQFLHPLLSRKRIGQAAGEVFGAGMWRAKIVIGMDQRAETFGRHFQRSVRGQLDVGDLTESIAQDIVTVGANGNVLQQTANISEAPLFEQHSFQRIVR